MEQLETMEYYILQTQDILNSVYKNKEQTNKLAQVYMDGNYRNIKIIASGSSGNGSWCAKYVMEKYLGVDVTVIIHIHSHTIQCCVKMTLWLSFHRVDIVKMH